MHARRKAHAGSSVDLWLMLEPSTELPGQWVSQCLNWGLVSQGNSPRQAFEMILECIALTVEDDLEGGWDTSARKPAPPEAWEQLRRVVLQGHRVDVRELSSGRAQPQRFAFSLQARIAARPARRAKVQPPKFEPEPTPPAWASPLQAA